LKDRVHERRLGLNLRPPDNLNFAAKALFKPSLQLGNIGNRVIVELDQQIEIGRLGLSSSGYGAEENRGPNVGLCAQSGS